MSEQRKKSRVLDRLAYQYIGQHLESHLDSFEDLRRQLRKAGIDKSLRMYLSIAIFYSGLVMFGTLIFGLLVWLLIPFPIIFIVILAIFAGILTYFSFTLYPSYEIGERKRKIENSLPTAAGYMTAMASAGVTPDKIFMSLSKDDIGLYISQDAKKITRDIEIFNLDVIRAIEAAAKRSPSAKYTSFLEGIVSTFTSGGDLQMYLQNTSETLMRDKVQTEKAFVESLGLMAELYLVLCVVTPTFAVVMLAMAALQGTMTHTVLTMSVLGIGVLITPILQMMIILLVDGLQPEA